MMTLALNLYYEIPGTGGGNELFAIADMSRAIKEFDDLVRACPEAYAELTLLGSDAPKLRQYEPASYWNA